LWRPPEYECRVADVAFLSKDRWDNIDPKGLLAGVPEPVIEVLSPSNTVAEIIDKKTVCLEDGAREFWVVDIDHRQVEVSTPDGRGNTYKSGQHFRCSLRRMRSSRWTRFSREIRACRTISRFLYPAF
jgi:Uma2 family endonuclease